MAHCQILFVTILIVSVSSQSDCLTSWLKISNRILVSVPYGNFRLDIYEQVDNNKLKTDDKCYFYSPIAQLDGKSATTSFNEATNQNEMRFRIEMWNDKVQSRVVQYLAEFFRRQVAANRVRVVPFEKVALASTTVQTLYKLSTDWLPFQQSMWFSMSCLMLKDCHQLANDMRTHPDQFDNLKLVYSPSSQTSQTFGTAPLHDIHFVQDSAPTADDWIELTATNSDLRKELNGKRKSLSAVATGYVNF